MFTCEFAEATVRLTKGRRRGELVQLRMWQGDLLCDMLRLRRDGRRLYRTYELYIARKNSKSMLGAALALDGLFDENGAEVYSAAGDKDQAKVVFKEVVEAVKLSEDLSKVLKVYRDTIEYPPQGSIYRAVSSEARLKEGLNPSRVIFDEKHVQKNDVLWNVLTQGSGTREQPLFVTLSTKGVMAQPDGQPTIAKRDYDYGKKVMSGEIDDPTWGCRFYEAELAAEQDYHDESVWWDPNPALGDFLFLEDMQSKVRSAPEADFKAKRLNIWVSTASAWLREGTWDRLAKPKRAPIEGEAAVVQFDGSYSNDSTAITAWLLGGDKPHLTLLALWERPDRAADWHVPVSEVKELLPALYRHTPIELGGQGEGRFFNPRWDLDMRFGVVFDPARWLDVFRELEEEGVPVVEYPNNATRMVPATQLFYDAVMAQGFTHDGHPALARHAANATTKLTSAGVMLDKKSARAHIDALVCSVFGFDIATQRMAPKQKFASATPAVATQTGNPFRGQGRLKI